MTKTRLSAIAIAAAIAMTSLVAVPASAQRVTTNDQPAEFPPDSFTGRQYVDSTGCVFVRAGFEGAVNWVPRISRSRTQLCGFTPTAITRSELPVIADAPGTLPPGTATTRPRVVLRPAPAPTPVVVVPPPRPLAVAPAPRITATAPRPVVQAPPRTVAAPVMRPPQVTVTTRRMVRATCPGAAAVSAQYINPGARCGPQAEHSGAFATADGRGVVVAGGGLPLVGSPPITVPPGYRPAWTDGRLNPDRGKQTLSGALQTALIWTQEVPRRLVDTRTGRDVTRDYNYLIYPYTDYNKQKRDLAGGRHIIVRSQGGRQMIVSKNRLAVSATTGQTILKPAATPTYSTKSVRPPVAQVAPPQTRAATPKGATGRFVQVASFAVAANAQSTAARLQRAGLPVRMAQVRSGGKMVQTVMAGPFADAAQARNALAIVRQAGFGDAYLRN